MSLYDTDFYAWTQAQAQALREKDWTAVDVDQLAEEIADVGNAVRFALESHLTRLLFHLLKLRADPRSHARHGWEVSIAQARDEIAKRATGSLREHPARYLPTAYAQARRRALRLVVLPLEWLPETCPWSVAQVLDDDFFPSEEGTSSATSRA
jgi:hypothetical protein